MNWFLFALATCLCWGGADLFYKRSADENDPCSHLKTAACVGLVMGLHAFGVLIFEKVDYDIRNLWIYLPVSAFYISSMTVGYLGLRYLELSVSSPIQNASGAVTCLLCLIFLGQALDVPGAAAVILICGGVFLLGLLERLAMRGEAGAAARKYVYGWKALLLPILYCVLDALGTFFDAYYLDDIAATPLVNVTEENFETVANLSYEFTFLIAALVLLAYVCLVRKQRFSLSRQKDRGIAAVLETAGQFTYVFAMSGNAVAAAPMIASYSIVSVILSRLFLKEKLTKWQYLAVCAVLAGILILGIMEGMEGE